MNKSDFKQKSTRASVKSEQLREISSLSEVQFSSINLSQISPPSDSNPGDCVFVGDEAGLTLAIDAKAACIIVTEKLQELAKSKVNSVNGRSICLFSTKNLPTAMSDVFKLFDQHPIRPAGYIHPHASIHPTAQVAATAYVGPYTVIDAYAEIAEHAVIESHVFVASFTIVGARTILQPYCSIGTPGFGYVQTKNATGSTVHKRIPQIGRVVIEEDCELGSFCAVDRAALTETRIGRGTKMDNFCHIAHNCQVGEHSILAAGFIMAGSSSIGRNTMAGGSVHLTDHVHVCDNVVMVGRTGVTKDIEKPGMYGGFPATDFKDSLRVLSSIAYLPRIRKQISIICKHLGIEYKEN